MTEKLYYEDPYIQRFSAVVTSCEETEKGYKAVLSRTAFFPEGGGQAADTGTIDGVRVTDVREREGVLYHLLECPLQEGKEVEGVLDFETRFSRMQQHSGEHIVSGLVHGTYGYDNVGFHLGEDNVTMDFNGVLTKEQLREIEWRANEVIAGNQEIVVSYPTKEALRDMTYRSKIEIDGQVRIVTIPGVDVCACCAPHVRRTGEIGILKLTNVQNYKGGVRVSMSCGFRALADYNEKERNNKEIMNLLSAKEYETAEAVHFLKDENTALKRKVAELKKELLLWKAGSMEITPTMVLFEEAMEADLAREYVNLLLEKGTKLCALFFGNETDGYRYIVGSRMMDTRPISKVLAERFDGRGGGKPEMVQGTIRGKKEEVYNYFICNFSGADVE